MQDPSSAQAQVVVESVYNNPTPAPRQQHQQQRQRQQATASLQDPSGLYNSPTPAPQQQQQLQASASPGPNLPFFTRPNLWPLGASGDTQTVFCGWAGWRWHTCGYTVEGLFMATVNGGVAVYWRGGRNVRLLHAGGFPAAG